MVQGRGVVWSRLAGHLVIDAAHSLREFCAEHRWHTWLACPAMPCQP